MIAAKFLVFHAIIYERKIKNETEMAFDAFVQN